MRDINQIIPLSFGYSSKEVTKIDTPPESILEKLPTLKGDDINSDRSKSVLPKEESPKPPQKATSPELNKKKPPKTKATPKKDISKSRKDDLDQNVNYSDKLFSRPSNLRLPGNFTNYKPIEPGSVKTYKNTATTTIRDVRKGLRDEDTNFWKTIGNNLGADFMGLTEFIPGLNKANWYRYTDSYVKENFNTWSLDKFTKASKTMQAFDGVGSTDFKTFSQRLINNFNSRVNDVYKADRWSDMSRHRVDFSHINPKVNDFRDIFSAETVQRMSGSLLDAVSDTLYATLKGWSVDRVVETHNKITDIIGTGGWQSTLGVLGGILNVLGPRQGRRQRKLDALFSGEPGSWSFGIGDGIDPDAYKNLKSFFEGITGWDQAGSIGKETTRNFIGFEFNNPRIKNGPRFRVQQPFSIPTVIVGTNNTSNFPPNQPIGEISYPNVVITENDTRIVSKVTYPLFYSDIQSKRVSLPDASKGIKKSQLKIVTEEQPFNQSFIIRGSQTVADDVEFKLNKLQDPSLAVDTDSERNDSIFFTKLIASNPILSTCQFDLFIDDPTHTSVLRKSQGDLTGNTSKLEYEKLQDLEHWINFRIDGLTIPGIKRESQNFNYGGNQLTVLTHLQPTTENKCTMKILLDRNLDELEYLVRVTGSGCWMGNEVTENGDYNRPDGGYKLNHNQVQSYDLSMLTEPNDVTYHTAILRVRNGRDISKLMFMQGLNMSYLEDDQYGKLPCFTFKNFRFISTETDFNFKADTLGATLQSSVIATWSKMSVDWVKAEDVFYSDIQANTDNSRTTATETN